MSKLGSLTIAALFVLSAIAALTLEEVSAEQSKQDIYGGYMYTDGKDPEPKVLCDYIDVSGDPNRVGLVLSNYNEVKTVNLPFTFNYYGVDYNKAYIGPTGAMSFVDSTTNLYSNYYTHSTIPSSASPNGLIAVYWSGNSQCYDWASPSTSRILHLTTNYDGERVFVVEWNPVNGGKFEAVFFETGAIKFQYQSAPTGGWNNVGEYCVIGIEKPDNTKGVKYTSYTSRTDDLFTPPFAVLFHMEEITIPNARLENGDGLKGDLVFAGSKSYVFTADVQHTKSWEQISWVSLTLAPEHEDIKFIYHLSNRTVQVFGNPLIVDVDRDACGHKELYTTTVSVSIAVDFKMIYPSEEPRNFTFYATGKLAAPAMYTPEDRYVVENDLEWNTDKVAARVVDGYSIDDNGFVPGLAWIEFYNLRIEYERSSVQPRTDVAWVHIADNFDTERDSAIIPGKGLSAKWRALSEQATMTFVFTIGGVPQENVLSFPLDFQIRVDTVPPSAVSSFSVHPDSLSDEPSPIDNDYMVFMNWTLAEDGGSGVNHYRIEASSGSYGVVRTVKHEEGTDSYTYYLGERTGEELPEGIVNISVRAVDAVGNAGPRSFVNVVIDRHGPTYELLSPTPGTWVKSNTPEVQVKVSDPLSGIHGMSLFYRWSRDGGITWSAWQSCNYFGNGELEYDLRLTPSLVEGRENLVEVKGTDLAMSQMTDSMEFPVMVDTRPPSISMMGYEVDPNGTMKDHLPDGNSPVRLSLHDHLGSGLDLGKLSYRYSTDDGETYSSDIPLEGEPFNNSLGQNELQVTIRKQWKEGEGNLVEVDAWDRVGRNTKVTFRVKVDVAPTVEIYKPSPVLIVLDNETIYFDAEVADLDGR